MKFDEVCLGKVKQGRASRGVVSVGRGGEQGHEDFAVAAGK